MHSCHGTDTKRENNAQRTGQRHRRQGTDTKDMCSGQGTCVVVRIQTQMTGYMCNGQDTDTDDSVQIQGTEQMTVYRFRVHVQWTGYRQSTVNWIQAWLKYIPTIRHHNEIISLHCRNSSGCLSITIVCTITQRSRLRLCTQ